MRILVTGSAGFIGHATVKALRDRGDTVIGIDNFNNYYDDSLKRQRTRDHGVDTYEDDITQDIGYIFKEHKFDKVVHLAAQAGVRYSIDNPSAYIQSNLVGFGNILELCRQYNIQHLVYASSSSVYGMNENLPFNTQDSVDHPVSLYAATKKSNELMAHSYSHIFRLPTTGLRFFTVYGPWGRPDMSPFLFTDAILSKKPIKVFNYGDMKRDFTYIDDIVKGILLTLDKVPEPDVFWTPGYPKPNSSSAPYRIYNIGNNRSENLLYFIRVIEGCLGEKAILDLQPMQAGDVKETAADITDLVNDVGYLPTTRIEDGLPKFVEWYRNYYKR